MRFHPLAPEVKCSACGGDLMFVRVRMYGDLYQCVSDPCRRQVMHYKRKDSKTCGFAALSGPPQRSSVRTPCDATRTPQMLGNRLSRREREFIIETISDQGLYVRMNKLVLPAKAYR
jgi:hypothetical protein